MRSVHLFALPVRCSPPLSDVSGAIEFPARSDREFCSDACRSLNWQRKNRVPISAYTVEDFAEVREVVSRSESRIARKARLIGYSLKKAHPKAALARIGEVEFPDPGRKTKRFPDESGVPHVRRERYFCWAPFEPPRVPVEGLYRLILHFADGSVQMTGDLVSVTKTFPSVLFYDKEGNRYDLKGKVIPKRSPATPKARRKYVPRKQRTVPTDEVIPVAPAILEHIRMAVARAVPSERETHRVSVEATQHLHSRDQVASLTEQLANLTTKLNATEARATQAARETEEQLRRVEERAVRAEVLHAESQQRAESAADAMVEAMRERNKLAERLTVSPILQKRGYSVQSAGCAMTPVQRNRTHAGLI